MKPIDEFFRDYLHPPLKAAGFKRKGRCFHLRSPLDDVAVVEVRSSPTGFETLGFWMKIALYPEPYRAFWNQPDEPNDAGWGVWGRQVGEGYYEDPDAPSNSVSFWTPLKSNAAERGPFLTATLERHVIPFLTAMLNRDRLLKAIKSGELTSLNSPFTVLADEGWTPELITAVAKISRQLRPGELSENRQEFVDFLRNRIPLTTPTQEREFHDAVASARRRLPPSGELLIDTVDTRAEHPRVGRRNDYQGPSPEHSMHAHLIAPDGTTTPCQAGPVEHNGQEQPWALIPIGGVPAEHITPGSTLSISQYRTDEVDESIR